MRLNNKVVDLVKSSQHHSSCTFSLYKGGEKIVVSRLNEPQGAPNYNDCYSFVHRVSVV